MEVGLVGDLAVPIDMKRVYFHIDEYNRDSIVASALKKYFASYHIELVYGARYLSESVVFGSLKCFDAIIVPKPHFLRLPKGVTSTETPIYCLLTESVGWQMSYAELAAHVILQDHGNESSNANVISRYFLWGEIGLDAITKIAPRFRDKMVVVGHPRLDQLCLANRNTHSDAVRIGIITRFPILNDFAQRKPIGCLSGGQNELEIDSRGITSGSLRPNGENDIFAEALEIKLLLDLIRRLSKSDLKHCLNISFRVHPREDQNFWEGFLEKELSGQSNINFELAVSSEPFVHWAQDMDFVIGPPSTSFFECLHLGVTPISIHNLDSRRRALKLFVTEEKSSIAKDIYAPSDIDELINFVLSVKPLKISKTLSKKLEREICSSRCGESLRSMVDIIISDISTKSVKPISLLRCWHTARFYLLRELLNAKYSMLFSFHIISKQSANFILTRNIRNAIDRLVQG